MELSQRQPQLDAEITPLDLRFSSDELDAERERITSFIQAQVDRHDADGVVLGLSGGVDSTAVAHLAVEALGRSAVHGLILPRDVNSDANMSDAERVAVDLGIRYDVVDIDPIMDELLAIDAGESASDEAGWENRFVGNTSARVRMTVNYLIANKENKLVLGTGNRVELALGYVTKYGDGGVDCNPIGNCYKQQVRQLAADLGASEELVQKTPTGGMVDYETDEEEIGVEYDTIDAIVALTVDGNVATAAAAEIADTTPEVVEHIQELHRDNEHKRTTPSMPTDAN
ncbi:NAD+ synthase [Halococcus thailandensis]|uniref:NH(3)-dependent NAD(+) synthetase n=1 Tax=Halococcus thailandensis JCM 13552 TaxID=1227457 RepID=M0N5N4_9EURY|nr:NAD+ synthase [Halococcus thailandensis]EMA52429.1 NAD synthetase [Halococcus thailandensis JCM 13552]